MQKWELSDYQWEQIKYFFPPKTSRCGRARRDSRELLNATILVLRTGSPWCALPEKYGPLPTVYNNFRKWSQQGIMEKIFNYFCANVKGYSQIQIDSTYVKAHQHSAGAKKRGIRARNREIMRRLYKQNSCSNRRKRESNVYF